MRILIVEDDRDLIMLLSDILRKGGYDVISAADGSEAWGILQREKIHFVITDWMMPKMDGLELCKRIRSAAFPYYIYIVMLTAKDAKGELVQGMEAGADDFLVKPFSKDELNVRVRAGERIITLETGLEKQNRQVQKGHDDFLSILNTLREGVVMVEKDGRISFLNRSALDLTEKPENDLLGSQWRALFPLDPIEITQLVTLITGPGCF